MKLVIRTSDIDLDRARESAREGAQQVQSIGRKAVLAYAGFWGLAFDEAKVLVDRGREALDRAEDRGGEVEDRLEEQVEDRVEQLRKNLPDTVRERLFGVEMKADIMGQRIDELGLRIEALQRSVGGFEAKVQAQVERVLVRADMPSRKRLDGRLDDLEKKVDMLLQQVERLTALETETIMPWPGYGDMTVEEVVARLESLNMEELATVKHYEMAHKDRVTVLRAVNHRLEMMPIPNFDELTVEEIEPLLNTLEAEALTFLAGYEAAHENRVTLLRAIEDELAERKELAA